MSHIVINGNGGGKEITGFARGSVFTDMEVNGCYDALLPDNIRITGTLQLIASNGAKIPSGMVINKLRIMSPDVQVPPDLFVKDIFVDKWAKLTVTIPDNLQAITTYG